MPRDKNNVSCFTEHAQQILEAAEAAAGRGEACSDVTILIGGDGGIHMISDSDWPLDSLALHHGARAAYRVGERNGAVVVEGRQDGRRCVLESRLHPVLPHFLGNTLLIRHTG